MAQVPAVHRARQVGGVTVPVKQVKGRRRLALEVVAHHVVPHQVVRAQEAEGGGEFLPLEQTGTGGGVGANGHLAHLDQGLVDEDVQDAGVAEVQQRGQQRHRVRRVLAARSQHRQRRAEDGAAHAETQGVDRVGPGDSPHHLDGLDGGVLDVVVPGLVLERLVGVAPADHKDAVALLYGVADHRVLGLQVQDVVLVDARRDEQHGPLMHLGRQGLVFDQLEQFVLEHHRAFAAGHVAAHLEHALVGLGDMALAHVFHQLLHALGQTLALGLQRALQRLGVGGQVVAGAGRVHPLLHRKADARLGLGVALHALGHLHQRAGVEQVHLRHVRGGGVGGPLGGGETPVLDGRLFRRWRFAGGRLQCSQRVVPQGGGAGEVLGLQAAQSVRCQVHPLHRLPDLRQGIPEHLGALQRIGHWGGGLGLHARLLEVRPAPSRPSLVLAARWDRNAAQNAQSMASNVAV